MNLFDSYGIEGMKHFIISDDKKIAEKILKRIETIDQKDKKLTFFRLKFSMNAYERLKVNERKKLSESGHYLKWKKRRISKLCCKCLDASKPYKNAKNCDLWNFSNIFYENLFFPENSKTRSYKKLTNDAIDRLLNELSTLDRERNEQLTNKYIRQKQINMT